MIRFHRRCGDRVTLLNQNLTAIRNFVEFNHGLILSAEPLIDNVIFEVRIDRKVNVWNGSLEVGVTTLDPEFMELPATATKLRNTAWILSGNSIVKDCITLVNDYGPELDSLREGECVGVTRTSTGELLFFINGRCLGVAARDIPERVFAVIDLYGQCVQVTITESHYSFAQVQAVDSRNELTQYVEANDDCGQSEAAAWSDPITTRETNIQMSIACPLVSQDHIRFHPRCGILVKLSSNNKTAERARPLDDYNNGVVMTHRPLLDNELFEIRIDKLVDKWSGSIEVGVTTHNPATIRFPSTMTNMDSGTIMMSGCKVLLNGHGTCTEYGNYNLDELREGDTVAMMRKSNDKLHYFINGVDQGVATDKVPSQVWGVIDLYGMTVRVTIIDPCEGYDSNISQSPLRVLRAPHLPMTSPYRRAIDEEPLLFHPLRDSNVVIINDNKTAHRPHPSTSFNNGVVMTNRTLKTNELFQVRLDLVIPKWAGSIEIGVTQQSSNDIKIPFKMSNEKSGTWAITGEDVIRDGTVIIPQYARNLNQLVEGDTVGVMRKELGILHFYINGIDQGPAAFNIPEHIFGIVDLYGRVAQATIIDMYTQPTFASPESPMSSDSIPTVFPDMCFHRVHGHNARLKRNRLTAMRATVFSEFNDAVLFSCRPLRECDMFEIRIDKMVDCWIGSLEIGVTAIRPDDLEAGGGVGAIAGTATDLTWDTYILSGAAMMKDGECVRSGYPLDLDTLTEGSRVGMMWHADRSVHYYLDGMDMGKAWYVPHLNIYAVVDLYGQCAQVSIVQNGDRNYNFNGVTGELLNRRRAYDAPPLPYWVFSEYCGDNIILRNEYNYAQRIYPNPDEAMVFSSQFLIVDEIFEVQILECKYHYAGNFRMGITDVNILNANVNRTFPRSIAYLPHFTAYIDSRYVKYSKPGDHRKKAARNSITPSFEWLRTGDRIGFKKTADSRVLVYYNSELLDTCFEKVPDKVYVCCDLGGQVTMIKSVPRGLPLVQANQQTIKNDGVTMQPAATNGPTANTVNNLARQSASVAGADGVITEEEATRAVANVMTAAQAAALQAAREQLAADEDEDEEELCRRPASSESWVSFNEEILVDFLPSAPSMAAMEDDTPSESSDAGDTPEPGEALEIGDTPDPVETAPGLDEPTESAPAAAEAAAPADTEMDAEEPAPAVNEETAEAAPVDNGEAAEAAPEAAEAAPVDNEEGARAAPDADDEPQAGQSRDSATPEPEPRRALPYTFHYLHGRNVRLCSSDTVAMRYRGYAEGIAIASQPIRRGNHFRFRVDRLSQEWQGTLCIGAVAALPSRLPRCALDIDTPAWVITNDVLMTRGRHIITDQGRPLDNITENSVLTLHFRFNSELALEIDGVPRGVIGVVPRLLTNIYPTIDLYGRVIQVSILLHPHVLLGGNSLDLPAIEENYPEEVQESPDEEDYGADDDEDEEEDEEEEPECEGRSRGCPARPALAWRRVRREPLPAAGPSRRPDWLPGLPGLPNANDARNHRIKSEQIYHGSLYHSLILPGGSEQPTDNDEAMKHIIGGRSASAAAGESDDDSSSRESLANALSLGSRMGEDDDSLDVPEICDTNIRHNDRYPEASDADLLDNEIVDALTLDASNMPDLTEERSPSVDESTRRDELWSDGILHVETLRYLTSIIKYSPEEAGRRFADRDWVFYSETNGNCEHMHLALKYWNYVVLPYPDMREVVASGQVRCYCADCQPEAVPPFAGWVRIERGARDAARGEPVFWHVVRSMLVAAAALPTEPSVATRPATFAEAPACNPSAADIWFDEEGKPHHTVLALEIDSMPDEDSANDKLIAYMIYLRSHMTFNQEQENADPLSFEDNI